MYGTYCRLNVHVSASDVTVIRACYKMITKKGRGRAMREQRHKFYRNMLGYHSEAFRLYRKYIGY